MDFVTKLLLPFLKALYFKKEVSHRRTGVKPATSIFLEFLVCLFLCVL